MKRKTIDDILEEAKKNGITEEIEEQIRNLELDNESLKSTNKALENKNEILNRGTSPSILERYKKSNENYKEKNSKLMNKLEKLQRKKGSNLAHLNGNEIGVYSRMLNDFSCMNRSLEINFPGKDHPIFVRFYELANKYPNGNFIISGISEFLNEERKLIKFEIKTQRKNINTWLECDKLAQSNPDTWDEDVSDVEAFLYRVTTVDEINEKIDKLEKDYKKIKDWFEVKENIRTSTNDIEIKNNLYHDTINEFKRIFYFCKNVGGITEYKASVRVDGFNKDDMYSSLTRELERQVGLCEEPHTHNFYYSNGEGRLIPYELNRQFLQYVNNNTTFVKYGKKNQYKSGNIINSKVLFEDIPLYCNKIQYRNPNLVGFNNCFYDITKGEIVPLNIQAPILPLKNTQTELYLDEEIEENPMQEIFTKCFTEKDRKTLLAYIGCALYDKGYTQRQESLFIMGKGGTGKTTLTKAICQIFYSVGHQLITKLSDNNQFGYSMFADSDVVVIDEIQAAKKEFVDKLKEISGGGALPVEKKHYDTISVPADNVPRTFFIGNNFSKKFYEASDNAGVKRRILIIIPTQPIQNLGYQWQDLITDSCKQWLVQQATKEYKAQGLDEKTIPITSISDKEKLERIEKCTYPEHFFIKKHFEVVRDEKGQIDDEECIAYEDFHNFISKCIDNEMLESTIKKGIAQSFIPCVKEALNLPQNYHTQMTNNQVIFRGIIPKSDEAIKYIKKGE